MSAASEERQPCTQAVTPPVHLPEEVLIAILKNVDLQYRLTVCAQVSRIWAAAAVAATTSVHFAATTPALAGSKTATLADWLRKHHGQVRHLCVRGTDMPRLQLQLPLQALQHLQQLQLVNCKVSISDADAQQACLGMGLGCQHAALTAEGSLHAHPTGPLQHLQLPCGTSKRSSLQHAVSGHLGSTHLTSSTASTMPSNSLAGAALTSLDLFNCAIDAWQGLPVAASALHNLRALRLQQLVPVEQRRHQHHSNTAQQQRQQKQQHYFADAAVHLAQLTQLVLRRLFQFEPLVLSALQEGLRCMTALQQLQLELVQLSAQALADLPPSLTLLDLSGAPDLLLTSAAVPGLTGLQHLRVLRVEGVRKFEPKLLSHLSALHTLCLRSTSSRFIPDGIQGSQDLLAALQHLTGLQTLDLRNVLQHRLPDQLLQAYCDLVSSRQLQRLNISACALPSNCSEVLLQPGCSLPYLRQLVLYRCEDPYGYALKLHSLQGLVACCPALEELALWLDPIARSSNTGSTGDAGGGNRAASSRSRSSSSGEGNSSSGHEQAGLQQQLMPLLQLPGLTKLVVAGPGVNDAEAAAIARLQGLSSLSLFRCSNLTSSGVMLLTQLRSLTTLVWDALSLVEHMGWGNGYILLQGPGAEGQGDAWEQCSDAASSQAEMAGHVPPLSQVHAASGPAAQVPVWQQLQQLKLFPVP